MKVEELRGLSTDELKKKAQDTREELFRLRLREATHQLENTARLRLLKRDIAQILTVVREKVQEA